MELDQDGFRSSEPTATFGSETDRILQQLGFDESTIEQLVENGIVRRELLPHGEEQ